jgi:hypothetical protein
LPQYAEENLPIIAEVPTTAEVKEIISRSYLFIAILTRDALQEPEFSECIKWALMYLLEVQ